MSDKQISRRELVAKAAVGATAALVSNVSPLRADTTGDRVASESNSKPLAILYGFDQEPYVLDSGPHLFVDWRYVMPGRVGWEYQGKSVGLFGENQAHPSSVEAIDPVPTQMASGIRLEAQRPEFIGPVIRNERPWEFLMGYNAMHYLDGKFRLWYETVPTGGQGTANLLCYAESDDGLNWRKPELGLIEYNGNKRNNIVFGGPACPAGYGASGVFLDPSAPANERVKVVFLTYATPEQISQFEKDYPNSVTPIGIKKKYFIKVAASPDGIHGWKILDGTLLCHMSDTQSIIRFDPVLKRYVGYFRVSYMGRRMIGISESSGFNAWPIPQTVLSPGPEEDANVDLYTNSASLYPGTRSEHLMFPTVYQRQYDSTAMRMASSLDGRNWNWVSRQNLVEPGPWGSWNGGCLFVGHGLTELPNGRVALPCLASKYPHKFPRLENLGQIGLFLWKTRRLSAIVADEDAEFYLQPMALPGQTLHLNFQTHRAGYVKVEVVKADGYALDNCQALNGDSIDTVVNWRGKTTIPTDPKGISLRIRMRAAKLFSFEVT